jgi:phospholipid/cholesterol/gamma-HCH transport system permease protein
MIAALTKLGAEIVQAMEYVGGLSLLFLRSGAHAVSPPYKFRRVVDQLDRIGVLSLPIVFLTSVFLGMVLSFQSAYQMIKFSAQIYIPSLVALSMTREIGPVLTALVVAGRVGAAITAEIGTMKVTEQIDALETLAANPIRYLVVPRLVAAIIALPLLTIMADIFGMFGGYIVGIWKLNIGSNVYINMTWSPLVLKDIFTGLFKSILFGGIIAIVGCFEGLRCEGGAEGVGKATMLSVVTSFMLIIATDCVLTAIFYFL